MTYRLNARLDDELAAKLERLQRRTNKSVTEVVRASIELYYERFEEASQGAARILDEAGFVGCGDADADLSTTYKDRFDKTLAAKTGA
jgi:predicted transcriptional regulator